WNPISHEKYSDGVEREPCAALYHELSHADDISRDQVPQGDCGDTGIPKAEVKATFAENKYRKGKGLSPRTEYKGNKLPKSMDDCNKQPKKKEPAKGPKKLCEGAGTNQCGSTNGDPHLVTFDKAYYDFQAVGEFVIVRSTAGDSLEVQARQAPMGSSRTVAVNSALAFRVASTKVELSITEGKPAVTLDGKPVEVPRGEKALSGGGALERRESDIGLVDGYDIRWPDGSGAAVDQIGTYGFRLLLKLGNTRAGKVQGLLGDFDGDPANDIVPAGGGTPLAQPAKFEQLYPSYADSWRIKPDQSLFTYVAGQRTATFTDRTFPDKPMTVTDLNPAQRARAEAICRLAGVTDPWQLLECVFDVGASGRPEFATSSAASEVVAPPAAPPIAATPIASGTLTVGGTDQLTFSGRAGHAVFVDITAPTLPAQCSPYRLLDPAGQDIGSGCNINGMGYIDRTELTVDGQYTVRLDPRAGSTGRATVRVYLAQDTNDTIKPNGPDKVATLDRPGSVARYRFTGTAGQRVYVDVTDSSLPNQCSPLELRDAADRTITSGCVINGTGEIDGTLLTATGTYTIVVDPRDRTLGTVALRLHSAADRTGTIAVNGPTVNATIDQPGATTRLTFHATAGSSVSLQATAATLPNQCSPLNLLDPAGDPVVTGCLINGEGGFGPTTVPTTGTYTLVVDPHGNAIGTLTLSLRG
ncbi:MAG: hypothetical protein QOE61_4904, partial [Micromonosporaceae bacterium]|nr:hypothetical protein [Micromonosporaceae bacterium]